MSRMDPAALEALIPLAAGVLGLALSFRKPAATRNGRQAQRALRWIGPALIVFAVFLFVVACGDRSADAATLAQDIKAKLALPVQVDAATRLDDIRAVSPTELGYYLTLTQRTRADLAASPVAAQLEAALRAGACDDPNYLTILRAGITIRVTYQTADAAEAARIIVTPRDCGLQGGAR